MIKPLRKAAPELAVVVLIFIIFASIGSSVAQLVKTNSHYIPSFQHPSETEAQWENVLSTNFEVSKGDYRYYCFNVIQNEKTTLKISLMTQNRVEVNLFVVSLSDFMKLRMGSSFYYYERPSMLYTDNGIREWRIPSGLDSFCIVITMPRDSWDTQAEGEISVYASPKGSIELVSEG